MKTFRVAAVAVLLAALLLAGAPQAAQARPNCQTIAQIAAGNPGFSTLVFALQTAGLGETLDGKGQYTVFAPTNAAFEALGDALAPIVADVPTLTNILLYHVARGVRDSSAVLGSTQIRMLNGQFAPVNASALTIANAPLNTAGLNIRACNGIIHVVDAVMVP